MGKEDWCFRVGEHLEVNATNQLSRSRSSHRNVRVMGVSYPCCLTLNPHCLSVSLSIDVCLRFMTPNGLQIFFWGYRTAKCSSDVWYTITFTPCLRPFGAIRVMLPLFVSVLAWDGSLTSTKDSWWWLDIATSVGIFVCCTHVFYFSETLIFNLRVLLRALSIQCLRDYESPKSGIGLFIANAADLVGSDSDKLWVRLACTRNRGGQMAQLDQRVLF